MKKSAIIIGGGIAGLAAARELIRAGMEVTVLEAKERCGGRIHTIKDHDFPIELGAEFVHEGDPVLVNLLHEAKLPTFEGPVRNLVFANGKFSEVPLWSLVEDTFRQIDPRAVDCSCEEFLSKFIGEPARTFARNFVEGYDAADPKCISAQALREGQRSADEAEGPGNMWVASGYGNLIHFLEREFEAHGGVIKRNQIVHKIKWHHGGAEVEAGEITNGRPPDGSPEFLSVPPPKVRVPDGVQKFAAETVIVTVPLGILQAEQIEFDPPVPEKIEAARKMAFGNVIKITFRFSEPTGIPNAFLHAFDQPIPTWWNRAGGPIVVGWAGGPKADALLKLFPANLEKLGLEILGRLFPDRVTAFQRTFIKSHYWNWANDPHILGAYSYIPVDGVKLPQRLAAPIADTLFFAGEATISDGQPGTVFGALHTGLRAAREVLGSSM